MSPCAYSMFVMPSQGVEKLLANPVRLFEFIGGIAENVLVAPNQET